MSRQIEIALYVKKDKRDDEYMIGSLDDDSIPVSVNLKEVTFIVFDPIEDEDGNFEKPGKLVIRLKKDDRQTTGVP
jgi:hypothetical protein